MAVNLFIQKKRIPLGGDGDVVVGGDQDLVVVLGSEPVPPTQRINLASEHLCWPGIPTWKELT